MSRNESVDPRSIVLRVEWALARQRCQWIAPDDPDYFDPAMDDYCDPADRRYLNPHHPSVQAYLYRYRHELEQGTGRLQPDDPAELRRRLLDLDHRDGQIGKMTVESDRARLRRRCAG